MCFSTEMSFAFACGGIAVAMVAWLKLNALGVHAILIQNLDVVVA